MLMNKKGMTSTVFNWVFVLIAGALIMLFFFRVINTQSQINENELTVTILKDMEDIIIGKQISTDSASEVKIANQNFEMECQEPCNELTGCDSWLGIKRAETRIELRTQPVFSIKKLTADKMYAFAAGWDVPFHTTNFLYLAVPGEKLIFPNDCNSDPLCNKVYTLIPQKLKAARIVIQGDYVGPTKYKKYIEFGVFSGDNTREREIVIDEPNKQIHFYEKGVFKKTEYYFLEEAIIGAVFTQDHQTYSCNMKKSFYKLRNMVKVLEGKRQYMEDYSPADPIFCKLHFQNIRPILSLFDTRYSSLNIPRIEELNNKKIELENENNELARGSCSSMY